eukprot:Gb_14835 [translate_table: standard]
MEAYSSFVVLDVREHVSNCEIDCVLFIYEQFCSNLLEDGGIKVIQSALHEDFANRLEEKHNNATNSSMDEAYSPTLEVISQAKQTRRGDCGSLRTSLAWDKAFFTNEGVLNPEELSLVNKTFKKLKGMPLPDIDEALRTSSDLNARFDGDDLALLDLEEKLFVDSQSPKQTYENKTEKIHGIGNRICKTGCDMDEVWPKSEEIVIALKKSSDKSREVLQKTPAKQLKDVSGKKGLPASTSFIQKVSSASKRVKDKLGKVLPANFSRTSGHQNSLRNVQDDSCVNARCTPSPYSSASESLGSAKLSHCYSYTPFERFGKPMPDPLIEIASLPISTSSRSSLDGMSSVASSIFSSDSRGIHSKCDVHNLVSHERSISSINMGSSAESHVLQSSRQSHGLQNTSSHSGSLSNTSMHARDDIAMASCIATHLVTKSGTNYFVNGQAGAYGSKPSGLRMPSPKLGFFDPARVTAAPCISTLHEKITGLGINKKVIAQPRMHAFPPRFVLGECVSSHQIGKLKSHGNPSVRSPSLSKKSSTSSIPSNSHFRPGTFSKSIIPYSSSPSFMPQRKFEFSLKAKQVPSNQGSDKKHPCLDSFETEAAVVIEDVENKLCPLSNSFQNGKHNQKGTSVSISRESQCPLSFSVEDSSLEYKTKVLGCQAIQTNGTETITSTKPGKASDKNEDINLEPGQLQLSGLLVDDLVGCSMLEPVKTDTLTSAKQIEAENENERGISEDEPFAAITAIKDMNPDFICDAQNTDACSQVSVAREQNGHSCELVESGISKLALGFRLRNEDKKIPVESSFSCNGLISSQTIAVNMAEPYNNSTQWSDWPAYEDVGPASGGRWSNDKVGSSLALLKQYHFSICPGSELDSEFECPIQDIKPNGRSPLAVNVVLLDSIDHQGLPNQPKREKGSFFTFAKKAVRRLTSSPVSANISGQENMSDGQHADESLHKSRRRNSMYSLSDGRSDTSPFTEERICALEAADEVSCHFY